MKTKHTPGTWSVMTGIHPVIRANDDVQSVIAHVQYDRDSRLISAAPELLEALQKAEEWVFLQKGFPGCSPAADAMLKIIRAAIQKATGEA